MPIKEQTKPILLFDDECGVCRRIARWVTKMAMKKSGEPSMIVRPIGNDPEFLLTLNPHLDIWDAYATIHVLMPDGSMKLGGEAVAEVFRNLPNTKWFTWTFAITVFKFRPFQAILNLAYFILADVRPLFGCESCGTPSLWVRAIRWLVNTVKVAFGQRRPDIIPHFTSRSAVGNRPARS